MPVTERACKACLRTVGVTPSGHLRAHACPHGVTCLPSYIARRRGDKGRTCAQCRAGAQLGLFPGSNR